MNRTNLTHDVPTCAPSERQHAEHPTITVFEFYVTPFDVLLVNHPEDSQVSDLRPGATIGFMLHVYDHDSDAREVYGFRGVPSTMAADDFVDGILMPHQAVLTDAVDALEAAPWAVVKRLQQEAP